MSAPQRIGWIGGATKYRDHLPVTQQPFYFDGATMTLFTRQPHLACDWTGAVVTTDEGTDLGLEMANGRGDGYIFAFGFSLKEFIRATFIVRQWHLELDATIAASILVGTGDAAHYEWSFGSVHVEFDYTFSVQTSNHFLPAKESDMLAVQGFHGVEFVLHGGGTYSSNDRGAGDHPGANTPRIENIVASITPGILSAGGVDAFFFHLRQDSTFGADESFQLFDNRGSGYGGWIDSKFWPRFNLDVGMSGGFFGTSAWRGLADNGFTETKGTLSLEDSDVSILGPEFGSAADNGGGVGVQTIDCAITPKKFWAYANKSGDQVYDEDSGDQLVDPFS